MSNLMVIPLLVVSILLVTVSLQDVTRKRGIIRVYKTRLKIQSYSYVRCKIL